MILVRTNLNENVLSGAGAITRGLRDLHVCNTTRQNDCLHNLQLSTLLPELAVSTLEGVNNARPKRKLLHIDRSVD